MLKFAAAGARLDGDGAGRYGPAASPRSSRPRKALQIQVRT
ncbi:hypothetical protein J2X45_000646 [Caulobacter sp. BE264]|nr:hypothetical protein [Caulobacter sp. BE264]MDR7229583.1 hypothetical protein [Caulobacter sp. BE264]